MFTTNNKLIYLWIPISLFIILTSACGFFGEDKSIESIEEISPINVSKGTYANEITTNKLPETIEVTLNDNSTETVEVDWTANNYDKDKADSYDFSGNFIVNDIKASVKAEVVVKENNIDVTTLDSEEGLDEDDISDDSQELYIKAEEEYNQNQDIEFKIFNTTDSDITFSNASLGLEAEKKSEGEWKDFESEIYCSQDEFDLAAEATAQIIIKESLISESGNYRFTFNSLEEKTGEVELEFKEANFEISDLSIEPDKIDEANSDKIEITAEIKNKGDISATQNIKLSFNKLDSEWGIVIPDIDEEISLDSNEEQNLVFSDIENDIEYNFSPGNYQAEINSENDQEKIDFEILETDNN